jgi:hypothetical protein
MLRLYVLQYYAVLLALLRDVCLLSAARAGTLNAAAPTAAKTCFWT